MCGVSTFQQEVFAMHQIVDALAEISRLLMLHAYQIDLTTCKARPLRCRFYFDYEVGVYKLSFLDGTIEMISLLANTKVLHASAVDGERNAEKITQRAIEFIGSLPSSVVMGSLNEDWVVFHSSLWVKKDNCARCNAIGISQIREAHASARQKRIWPAAFSPIDDQLLPYAFHFASTKGYIEEYGQQQIAVFDE